MIKNKIVKISATAFSCIFSGLLIGVIINSINGAVSPLYFRNIMRWQNVNNIWRATVAQGIFEGIIYGVIFAVIFTAVAVHSMKNDYQYLTALKYIGSVAAAILFCWVIGGLLAMGLATLSPEFYRTTFIKVPEDFNEMLKYAWVGGSIWGAVIGTILSGIIACVLFKNKTKSS